MPSWKFHSKILTGFKFEKTTFSEKALKANKFWKIWIFFAFIFEEVILSNILLELSSILYAGALSGGIAFTLQMYAQKNIEEAPAAIIYSLEGVFAAIAGWIILDQFLKFNNIIGCFLILFAVILSQILPTLKINNIK